MAIKAEVKEYLTRLAQQFGVDEKTLLEKAEKDESVSKFVDEGLMLRSDYSRKQDELAQQRTAVASEAAETLKIKTWYAKAFPEWEEATKKAVGFQTQLQTYIDTYGPLEGVVASPVTGGGNGNADYLTRADLQKELEKLNNQAVATAAGIVSEGVPLALEHFQKTGKIIDFNALVERAKVVSQVPVSPLRRAYEDLTRTEMTALDAAARAKELDQVRADAVRDFQSKNNIPIDTSPRTPSTIGSYLGVDRTKAPSTDDQKLASFMAGFNSEEAIAARDKA